jgi:hypothetical protein
MAVQPFMAKATTTGTVSPSAGNTVISPNPGRLLQVLVTATGGGTGDAFIFDSASAASGTIVGVIPATATIGTLFTFDMPVAFGIVAQNVASGPALTVAWH